MKVSDILRTKGGEVRTIGGDQTVYEAVKTLIGHNIGALLVVDVGETVIGIITERDVLRECARKFESLNKTKVSEVMTSQLIIGAPDDDIEYVQAVMTNNHIRHLPIVADRKLKGLISIGDVVKVLHHEAQVENRDLKDFISGRYIG